MNSHFFFNWITHQTSKSAVPVTEESFLPASCLLHITILLILIVISSLLCQMISMQHWPLICLNCEHFHCTNLGSFYSFIHLFIFIILWRSYLIVIIVLDAREKITGMVVFFCRHAFHTDCLSAVVSWNWRRDILNMYFHLFCIMQETCPICYALKIIPGTVKLNKTWWHLLLPHS